MGQKTRPTGFRIGVVEDWRSRWYAPKKEYGSLVVEDFRIRKYLREKLKTAGVARIEIERTRDNVTVLIHTARPGILIGKKGEQADKLKAELETKFLRRMEIKVVELSTPFLSAYLVAEDIAQQLIKRGSFRRAIKRALEQVIDAGAFGCKVQLSGRLGGAEMSRVEKASKGSIPLSTLQRNVQYGFAEALTTMGILGVKVWIDLGDYKDQENTDGADAKTGQVSKKPKRSHKR